LFALPIPDTKDANTPDEKAKWKYALDVKHEEPGPDIKVKRLSMPAKWDWPLESPLKLQASVQSFDWNWATNNCVLPAEPIAGGNISEKVTLVPYGCAKFRISMFPVTERAWKVLETGTAKTK
jgi:hypothetical protein